MERGYFLVQVDVPDGEFIDNETDTVQGILFEGLNAKNCCLKMVDVAAFETPDEIRTALGLLEDWEE